MSRPRFAVSREDYIKTLWELARDGEKVIAAQLCRELEVSSAAVSKALQRLLRDRLVTMVSGGAIALTAAGNRLAERLVRRHRLVEKLLYEALEFPWEQVHEEAERLEHAISDRLEARLLARFGEKSVCPHGYPVNPQAPARPAGRPLSDFEEGQTGSVARVYEKDPALLKLFAAMGMKPGAEVRILRKRADETLEIRVGTRKFHIGFKAARVIWISTASRTGRRTEAGT